MISHHQQPYRNSGIYSFRSFFLFIVFWTCGFGLWGQSITVRVTSAENGKPLYHAYVQNVRTGEMNSADEAGILRMTANIGDSIRLSYVGFQDSIVVVKNDVTFYKIALKIQALETVVIFSEEPFNRRASLGVQEAPMEFLTAVPSLTGDADIMKTITFLPGVSEGREGYSHLFVRGGGQDQNLILYDGATLYNVNHFGGFISMFHSDIIQSVDFYKSHWPSRFGGKLSSVMDIRSRSGDFKEYRQSIDLGIIYAKANATGPLLKNKISYSVGARRTFIDLITGPLIRKRKREQRLGAPNIIVHDFNPRIDFRIKSNQYLSISGIHALDRFYYFDASQYAEDDEYRIRNRALAANYALYFRNTTLKAHASVSDYLHFFDEERTARNQIYIYPDIYPDGVLETITNNRNSGNTIETQKLVLSGVSKIASSVDLQYGLDFEALNYSIFLDRSESVEILGTSTLISSFSDRLTRSHVYSNSIFSDVEYSINPRMRIKSGIRLARYQYGNFVSWLPEPKVLTTWDLTKKSTISASYNMQQQYSHLLGFTSSEGYFREFYISADQETPTSSSHQWSVGYFRTFDRLINNLSIELFYKKQSRLSRFVPTIDEDYSVLHYKPFLHTGGHNRSYGLEILLQKTQGHFHGSLAYTYGKSQSSFPTLNQGKCFDSDFDYRHNINALLIWKFGDGYKLSCQWSYKSGRPFTLPTSQITENEFTPRDFPVFGAINNYRMPAYHRLDLSLDRAWTTQKKGKNQWFGISVYNAYDRVNPFFAAPDGEDLKIYGFFPIIPSFHFGFEL